MLWKNGAEFTTKMQWLPHIFGRICDISPEKSDASAAFYSFYPTQSHTLFPSSCALMWQRGLCTIITPGAMPALDFKDLEIWGTQILFLEYSLAAYWYYYNHFGRAVLITNVSLFCRAMPYNITQLSCNYDWVSTKSKFSNSYTGSLIDHMTEAFTSN